VSSRRRHTRFSRDWSSDVCSSDLGHVVRLDVAAVAEDAPPEAVRTGLEDLGLHAAAVRAVAEASLPGLDRLPAAAGPARHREERSEERRVGQEWSASRGAEARSMK